MKRESPPPGPPPGPRSGSSARRNTGIGLAAALLLAGLLLAVPGDEDAPERTCRSTAVTGWRPDDRTTGEFARYGDDNSRTDDWTGGDGTRSVRLPDGRTLWLSADTFLDRVYPGGRRVPQPSWVRNSALVGAEDGRLRRTLLGTATGGDGRPTALFPGGATGDGREMWRWPADAVVEPRAPGSAEQVVRVLLWQREAGQPPWVFGVPRATEVATLSLPDLRLEGVERVHGPPPGTERARRVLYGTSAVRDGDWTYVFGADEAGVRDGGASRAYAARVPHGRLADPGAWRHWDGDGWSADASAARPLDFGGPGAATNTYTVTRRDGTWLLLSMDAGGPDGRPSQTVVSYWACAPEGPWHGPHKAAVPPLPPGAEQAGATAYNPQAHPEFTGADGRLLLGYDVNVTAGSDAIHRDVALYRPRFLRLDLGPVDGTPDGPADGTPDDTAPEPGG